MGTPFAITDLRVLPCDAAGTVLEDHTVVVGADGRIATVGPTAEVDLPRALLRIDGRGKHLLPGLINAHAHLFADGRPLPALLTDPRFSGFTTRAMRSPVGRRVLRRRARRHAITQLHTGVTTLRTVGDVAHEVIETRDAIEAGHVLGPRILPSGPLMAITGGHGAPQIALIGDDPRTARANARENIRAGAEAIKIAATGGVTDATEIGQAGSPEMSEESMRAVCEEAHSAGILVAAHAQGPAGIGAALRAGVDTIEHGSTLSPDLVELFLDNHAALRGHSALIPTLQASLPLVRLPNDLGKIVRANAETVGEGMFSGLRTAVEHGVTMGVGTDSGVSFVTHSNFWRELHFLHTEAGLSRAAVLHAATQVNAQILGLQDVTGSVEVGKDADLLVDEGDPMEDFRHLAQPWLVVARGERIPRPVVDRIEEVDALLDSL